jgi:hypothetical protein
MRRHRRLHLLDDGPLMPGNATPDGGMQKGFIEDVAGHADFCEGGQRSGGHVAADDMEVYRPAN